MDQITVVGGGLAGTEAAWQAAQRGVHVTLFEMRPRKMTPAHTTGKLAELVCSNSLGSEQIERAPGLLKHELVSLGSLIVECATQARVPAGSALAVDRDIFSGLVDTQIASHPNISVVREEVTSIPAGVTVIASGPLTSETLAAEIRKLTGSQHLYFWDAIAPIVTEESVDYDVAFRASRYGRHSPHTTAVSDEDAGLQHEGDYINCPMSEAEYNVFVNELINAEMAILRDFELSQDHFFEGCLPVEVMAQRGKDALAYGPMRPVGIRDPRTGQRPYAVVQLRQDNIAGTLYNLVGFQTNLKFQEQDRVLRLIPGLQKAVFVRYGQIHRNTFINSPLLLDEMLRYHGRQQIDEPSASLHPAEANQPYTKSSSSLFFAGQIVGAEGYLCNAATGLIAGMNAAYLVLGKQLVALPQTTLLGALCYYVSHADPLSFQPMKANFGILPPLAHPPRDKRARAVLYSQRAQRDLAAFRLSIPELQTPV